MKVSFKIATGLALTVAALACGSAARAGEGGAAGSVSIRFSDTATSGAPFVGAPPAVDRLSSSVAVGKNFAAATALTETGAPTVTPLFSPQTRTAAVGAAGTATLNDANASAAAYTYTAEATTALIGANQVNTFGGGGAASLAPITGVTLP